MQWVKMGSWRVYQNLIRSNIVEDKEEIVVNQKNL